jgi:hypothetical protein
MEKEISGDKIGRITDKFNEVLKSEGIDDHKVHEFSLVALGGCQDPMGICGPGFKYVISSSTGLGICVPC